jgi:hypothetical protein
VSKKTAVTAAPAVAVPAVESAPTVRKFAVTVVETETNTGRAFVAKCNSVGRLIDAFGIVVEDLGQQVGLQPLPFPYRQPEDVAKSATAGSEKKYVMRTKISFEWDVRDIKCVRPQLTKEPCCQVLAAVEHNFDASIGVNWDVIKECADELFPMDKATAQKVDAFDGHSLVGFSFAEIQKHWDEFMDDLKAAAKRLPPWTETK